MIYIELYIISVTLKRKTMKKIITILFFINFYSCCKADDGMSCRVYEFHDEEKSFCHCDSSGIDRPPIFYDLTLFDNGKYEFAFTLGMADEGYAGAIVAISFGNYTMDEKKLVLTDIYNKFKLSFIVQGKKIIAEHTFKNMKGLTLTDKGRRQYGNYSFFPYIKSTLSEDCLKNNKNNNTYKKLNFGTYFGPLAYTSLTLIKPNMYVYSISGCVFSEGTFKRNGDKNELILHDTSIDHSFYFFIEDKNMLFDNITHDHLKYLSDEKIKQMVREQPKKRVRSRN